MKTITDIKAQRRKKDRVSVYLDEEFWIGMPAGVLTDEALAVGDQLDDERQERILHTVAEQVVLASAVSLISHRARSESELRGRLQEKEYGDEAIDFAVKRLFEWGMLNDESFAEEMIAGQKYKGRARRTVLFELTRKGLDRGRSQELLDEHYPEEEEREVAEAWLRTKRPRDPAKAQRQLAARGFGWDVIKVVVAAVVAAEV